LPGDEVAGSADAIRLGDDIPERTIAPHGLRDAVEGIAGAHGVACAWPLGGGGGVDRLVILIEVGR
jgi:hypothetical protein